MKTKSNTHPDHRVDPNLGASHFLAGSPAATAEWTDSEPSAEVLPSGELARLSQQLAAVAPSDLGGPGGRHAASFDALSEAREALARAASAFYHHPSRKLKVIGIAGCSGKTSMAFIIRNILHEAGIQCGLISSIGPEIASHRFPVSSRPFESECHNLMARMVTAGCQTCVMETDIDVLAKKRSIGVDFDVAIFSNYHLQGESAWNSDFASRFSTHCRGFLNKTGTAVIGIDNACEAEFEAADHYELVLTYGTQDTAKIRASHIVLGTRQTHLLIEVPGHRFTCRLPLVGRQNIYNTLAAVGACRHLGVRIADIRSALEKIPQVTGRMERLRLGMPFDLFIDRARTPKELARTLRLLREITRNRLILVFGASGDTDTGLRTELGWIAAELADFSILTTDNPLHVTPRAIAGDMVRGFARAGRQDFLVELDRALAIQEALEMARPGDVLLIAGKGHETFQRIEDVIVPFDDRECATEIAEWIRSCLCD